MQNSAVRARACGSHMPVLRSHIDTSAEWFTTNCDDMREQLAELDELQQQAAAGGGPRAMARMRSRDKMPVRERIAMVLDRDSPFFEISSLAGYCSKLRRRRRAGDGHRRRERRRVHDRGQRPHRAGRGHHGVRRPQDHAGHRDLPRQSHALHPVRGVGGRRPARRRRPRAPDARAGEPLRRVRPAVL